MRRGVIPICLAAVLAGACALFAEGPPENVCGADTDCFRAQGEVCDLETNRCVAGPDAGVPDDATLDAAADAASN